MFNLKTMLIIFFALAIVIPISRILVNQLGKLFSTRFIPYFYLIIAIIPIYEIIHLSIFSEAVFRLPYFYFWIIFLITLIIFFIVEKIPHRK